METTKHVLEIGQRSYDNKGVRKRPTIPFSRNVDREGQTTSTLPKNTTICKIKRK